MELAAIEALGKGEMDDMEMAKLRRQLGEANATRASAEQQMQELMPALSSLKQQLRVLVEEKALGEEELASLKRQVRHSHTLSIHPITHPLSTHRHTLLTYPTNTSYQYTL